MLMVTVLWKLTRKLVSLVRDKRRLGEDGLYLYMGPGEEI